MAFTSRVIAGGDAGDFALVRHVCLEGSQQQIGFDLAEIAWRNHRVRPEAAPDPSMMRARRRWRELHWPELEARAQGVAQRWELPDDDRHDVGSLPIGFPQGGCSAVWLPADRSTSGASMLSRNFDFVTLTLHEMMGAPPQDDDEPFCGRPYVLETRPADGHATLTVTAFNLLSGAVDGINDAGLVAALFSDDESTTGGVTAEGLEPTFASAVGISEVEFCRYVLETCSDVDEALEAVRIARQYYFFHPQHFLVADRSGRSFVYEYATAHNAEHVVWGEGVQVITNHLLFRYPTLEDLPTGDGAAFTYSRARKLTGLFSERDQYSPEEIVERTATVRFTDPVLPVRTLWHALYDTETCAMDISFHVRDSDHGDVRSPCQHFSLASTNAEIPTGSL